MSNLVVREKDALSQMLAVCTTPSEITLVKELYVTAANAKTELDPHLNREFLREFAKQNPEALAWAFHEWRASSRFQPAISEIWLLLDRYQEKRRIEVETEAYEADKKETARRLVAGEKQVSYADIQLAIRDSLRRMDEQKIPDARRAELREQVKKVSMKSKVTKKKK